MPVHASSYCADHLGETKVLTGQLGRGVAVYAHCSKPRQGTHTVAHTQQSAQRGAPPGRTPRAWAPAPGSAARPQPDAPPPPRPWLQQPLRRHRAAGRANTGRLAHALVAGDMHERPGPLLQAQGGRRAQPPVSSRVLRRKPPAAQDRDQATRGAHAALRRRAGRRSGSPGRRTAAARGAPALRGTRRRVSSRPGRPTAGPSASPGRQPLSGRAGRRPGHAAAGAATRPGRGTGRPPAPAAHRPAPPGAAGPPRPATAGRRASRPPPLAAGAARVTRRCCAVAALPGDSAYARTSEDHGQALCLDGCKALCARSASADSGHAWQALIALKAGGARLCRAASDQSPAARHVAPSS